MSDSAVLLKNGHYMLYHLALAMYPRILCTFDTDLAPCPRPCVWARLSTLLAKLVSFFIIFLSFLYP